MNVRLKTLFLLVGALVVSGIAGRPVAAAGRSAEMIKSPPRVSLEQRLDWEREAIRAGFKFSVTAPEETALSCLVRGGCPDGVPFKDIQYARLRKAVAASNCKPSPELTDPEAVFCSLIEHPAVKLFDRFYALVKARHSKSNRTGLIGAVAQARGYLKAPGECQGFVRQMVGHEPSAWTPGAYQEVVYCKILFEGPAAGDLETDLSYFRLSRIYSDAQYCDSVRDADIKAFCQGPFPIPLPRKP